jgi:predicted neutral ceramidase superfamily lipid hydrolase
MFMPVKFIPMVYTFIFVLTMVAVVPRAEIRRLSIYGIIFGAIFDVIAATIGYLTGLFGYIDYQEFGIMAVHFFAPISWAVFYVLYFYFLPKKNIYRYVYVLSGIFYSVMFSQVISKLGILNPGPLIYPIILFIIWFPLATLGYLKLVDSDKKPGAKTEDT